MSADMFNAKNINNVVEKVTSMARQYYEDDESDSGGLIGIIGMLVIGGIFLLILLTVIPAVIGLALSLFSGGLGGQAGGLTIPLATLNANNGRRRRAAGTGISSSFNFQKALTTLEKAYKAYSESK